MSVGSRFFNGDSWTSGSPTAGDCCAVWVLGTENPSGFPSIWQKQGSLALESGLTSLRLWSPKDLRGHRRGRGGVSRGGRGRMTFVKCCLVV